jgi:hypothetical protein
MIGVHREAYQVLTRLSCRPWGKDSGTISHSPWRLETRGVSEIGRSPGGKADYVVLISEGRKWGVKFE